MSDLNVSEFILLASIRMNVEWRVEWRQDRKRHQVQGNDTRYGSHVCLFVEPKVDVYAILLRMSHALRILYDITSFA